MDRMRLLAVARKEVLQLRRDPRSLILAFLIGIGFGFFLERAGFGSARKLVSQFYLDDLAVFKVMFTAIVTAMLGVTYLSWIGFLDLELVYLVPTYWIAQVVGGLLLGVGFVVGGYCPGTSVVSTATGKLDGVVFVLGFAAVFLAFSQWAYEVGTGEWLLVFLPPAVVCLAIRGGSIELRAARAGDGGFSVQGHALPILRDGQRQRAAVENDCVASATAPAKYGPIACPMPKTIVIKPRAAGASRAPNTSPARAAIRAGMLHAVNANSAEEK
mgnify:CR=1 FL=1